MLVVTAVFAVVSVVGALTMGFLLGHYGLNESSSLKAACDKLQRDVESLSTELSVATTRLSAALEENAGMAKRVAGLTRHYLDQTDRMRASEQQRIDAEAHSRELESEIALLRERGRHLAAKVAEQATDALHMQKELMVEIEGRPIHLRKAANEKRADSAEENTSIADPVPNFTDRRLAFLSK